MPKHSTAVAQMIALIDTSSLIERKNVLPVSRAALSRPTPVAVPEKKPFLPAISGHDLIDKIDALGFTQQDTDEMMNAVQEGRKVEYERWSRKLFD